MLRVWRDPEAGPLIAYWMGESEGDPYEDEEEEEDAFSTVELAMALVDPGLSVEEWLQLFERAARRGAFDEDLPFLVAMGIVADALDPEERERPRLVNVPKEVAVDFVRRHHSAFEEPSVKGLLYAIGVAVGDRLVAVALANTPSSQVGRGVRPCPPHGILELSRIASVGTDLDPAARGASSMLAARLMDLLAESGRYGVEGCLFVTYSLVTERGTTYLSLAGKGLRPVAVTKPAKAPTGARKGAVASRPAEVKIRWEAGPDALPPRWELLQRTAAAPKAVEGAREQFQAWERSRSGREDPAKTARQLVASLGAEAALAFAREEHRQAEEGLALLGPDAPPELRGGQARKAAFWAAALRHVEALAAMPA